MSTIKTWTLTVEELEESHNQVKDILLEYLVEEGYLEEEDAEELMLTRQVLVKEPGAISALYRRILGKAAVRPHIMIAKSKRFESKEKKDD